MKPQKTIEREAHLSGKGLFTGEPVSLKVKPGEPGTGIWFVRTDQSPTIRIPALVENVSKRARRTALKNGTVAVETVEHCLSAIAGLGIDNLQIELDGNELPGLDGSCLGFVEQLRAAGIREQDAPKTPFVIEEITRVVEGDSELVALPPLDPAQDILEISYDLDYGEEPIGHQQCRVHITPENFEANIAPARTFVLEREAVAMREAGLGTHLSYQDILVFSPTGPIENELRFPDECVRHKILDLVGDLFLFGAPVIGRIQARKSGHALNHELVRALRLQRDSHRRKALLEAEPRVDTRQVQRILPHRYPFLLIDRVVEVQGTRRAVGIKNVTINEPFFQGHYPGEPIMPGVLIIEALAQLGGVLLSQSLQHKGRVAVLLSLDRVKFRRAVRPGDQLLLEVTADRVRATSGHVRGVARVGDVVVAESDIKFILTDSERR